MTQNRENWSSRLGFILAAGGSAIGLGTMWMLPFVVGQNGGGAFILLFLAFTICVGIPLFISELLLGRSAQRGVVATFAHFSHQDSSWKAIGWMGVATTYLVAAWYAVIAGWGLNYLLMALLGAFEGKSFAEVSVLFDHFRQAGDMNVLWQAAFIGLTSAIVLGGVAKGIERWTRILMSGLFVMLIGLAIYSTTLPGFYEATQYILVPNFAALSPSSVLKALALALFALSLGEGIMVTYGSYLPKNENIPKTAMIIGLSMVAISVLVALMIFPMVFSFGLPPSAGEGLIFKTLPYAFENLPGGVLLLVMFFAFLVFAGITSAIAQFEVIIANHMDLHQWSRKKAVLITAVVVFVMGLPTALAESPYPIFPTWPSVFHKSFLETNYALIDWMLCLFALATSILVGFRLDAKRREESFFLGVAHPSRWVYLGWLFLIRFFVPIAILIVIGSQANLLSLDFVFGS